MFDKIRNFFNDDDNDDSPNNSPKFGEVIKYRTCWNCQYQKEGDSTVRSYSNGENCYECGRAKEGGYESDYREVEYMGKKYFDPIGLNAADYAKSHNLEIWSNDFVVDYDENDLVP